MLPVKEVANNNIQRDIPALILPRHIQQLLLIPIPQLTLPEPKPILRHHRHIPSDSGIRLLNLRRPIPSNNPIIQCLGRVRLKAHRIRPQHSPPYPRVIPQQPVPQRRQRKRHTRLRVAVRELNVPALEIQPGLLVLAHAEDLLARVERLKPHREVEVASSRDWAELARFDFQGAAFGVCWVASVPGVLFQELFVGLGVVDGQFAAFGHYRADFAVGDACF